jgi:cell division protein FtsB
MKIFGIVVLSIFLLLLTVQIYSFWTRERDLSLRVGELEADLQKAQSENAKLSSDFKYLSNPVNLEKELRARFNYSADGEKMIIITPKPSSSPQ